MPVTSVRIILFLLFFSLFACGGDTSSPSDQDTTDLSTAQSVITADGNNLFYYDQGSGDTTLLFIHGWCIDGSYFQSQMDHLEDRYRVISIDLPGHGKSDAKRTEWTLRQFSKDVVAVVQHLGLSQVILVGHSMSEVIVAEAAAQLEEQVIAIIGIDTFIDPVEQVKKEDSVNMMGAMVDDFKGTIHNWMGSYFPASTDTAITQFILNDMAVGPPDICVSIMQDIIRYQNAGRFPKLLSSLDIPIRTINAVTPNLVVWQGIEADFAWLPLQNSGHYPMLEVPEQLNQAIDITLTMLDSQ